MQLTFKNPNGKIETIGEVSTKKELYDAIHRRLNTEPFDIPYFRIVGLTDNSIMIDYGSHISFFYLDASYENYEKLSD